jgi:hypothetical protein
MPSVSTTAVVGVVPQRKRSKSLGGDALDELTKRNQLRKGLVS